MKSKQVQDLTPTNWKTVSFSEIVDVSGGSTPDSKNPDYWNGDIPWLTPKDITNSTNVHVKKTIRRISQLGLENGPRTINPVGCVLMSSRAPVGIPVINDIPMAVNQGFIVINCKNINNYFLYYWIKNNVEYLKRFSNGTTFEELSKSNFKTIKITLPKKIEEQKEIGKFINNFDAKIQNIQNQKKILSQIIETIFKSWFVDFDGITEFVDSELGKIPNGWRVDKLKNHINVKHGYAFSGEFIGNEPTKNILLTPGNFLPGGGFKNNKFKFYDGPILKNYCLNGGDLIVTMTDLSKMGDTLGFPIYVPKYFPETFLHNQRLGKIIIKPNSYLTKHFLYNLFCSVDYRNEILASLTGTSVQHTSPERIEFFNFVLPDDKKIIEFNQVVESMVENQFYCEKIIEQLTKTRDILLPKLMSGEIRV